MEEGCRNINSNKLAQTESEDCELCCNSDDSRVSWQNVTLKCHLLYWPQFNPCSLLITMIRRCTTSSDYGRHFLDPSYNLTEQILRTQDFISRIIVMKPP
jgi:hypothetical protein